MTASDDRSALNRDTIVGIVGAVILVAAMAGVFLYERGQFATYDVTWEMAEAGTMPASGTLEEGEDATHTVTVEEGSLARVRVTLTWTDDTGDPDTFEVEITGPDGAPTGSSTSDTSPLEAAVEVVPRPEDATVAARDEAAARDQAVQGLDTSTGHGEWTITVTLTDAPGQTAGGLETQPDGENGYDLVIAWDTWEAVLGTGGA